MWGLSLAGSPFSVPQGFWSLSLLSRVMAMIVLSLEQLLQLWVSKPAGLLGFPQPHGLVQLCLWTGRAPGARSEAQGHWQD